MEIKNVSFVGCGALGMMYASHMLKSLEPTQLQFIADPKRISRYRDTAFYANGERQDYRFVPYGSDTEKSELIIFTVKSYDLEDALASVKGHIDKDTIILSFLNGVQSEGIIGQTYDPKKVIPSMVAGMDATRTGNEVMYSQTGYVAFGAGDGTSQEDLDSLARFFERVRLPYKLDEDIMKTIWWKYMLNVGVNQTSAVLRAPYGFFQDSDDAKDAMLMGMREVYEVSQKMDIGLDESDIDEAMRIIGTLAPEGKTSMLQDICAQRPTEIEIFAGNLIKLAKEHGVPVPVNTFLYHAIKALESNYGKGF